MIWALCMRGDNQTSFVLAVSSATSWFVRDSVALTAVVRVWLFLIKSPCKPVAPSFCSTFYNSKESRGSPTCCHAEQESCERQGRHWSVRNIDVKLAATPVRTAVRGCMSGEWHCLPTGFLGGSQLGGSSWSRGTAVNPKAVLSTTDPKSKTTVVGESGGEAAEGGYGIGGPSLRRQTSLSGESFCRGFIVKLLSCDVDQKSM